MITREGQALDTRRDFLRQLGAASLAALAAGAPRSSRADEAIQQPKATADTCILLWMAGGMAAGRLTARSWFSSGPRQLALGSQADGHVA